MSNHKQKFSELQKIKDLCENNSKESNDDTQLLTRLINLKKITPRENR